MNWFKSKFKERSSLDGILMVAAGASIIVFGPFTQLIAYGAIVWGAWTIFRKD